MADFETAMRGHDNVQFPAYPRACVALNIGLGS
jgi:hypothetical protein